ncbi:MAG: NAD(P)H-hydrate dehydratase, partial [Gammaproteobacteria bacterium]|nr:NAD(P)H-hydrate dehydratase [Gammaproteobacteria bacterium]
MLSGAELAAHAERVHAIAVGPGLVLDAWGRELWQAALHCRQPLVVDAGALRCLAEAPVTRENWVLTPHPGEAAMLLESTIASVEADRFAAARELARRYGGVCVLKGGGTLVATANEEIPWLCDRGNPGLASGGTGDVLTGIIVSLLAQGLAPRDAARLGVFVHASAADRAAEPGERGLLAADLFEPLRTLINDLAHAD